jgi:hypothetical protein
MQDSALVTDVSAGSGLSSHEIVFSNLRDLNGVPVSNLNFEPPTCKASALRGAGRTTQNTTSENPHIIEDTQAEAFFASKTQCK